MLWLLVASHPAVAQMSFLATGDWGGQGHPPFYNDVEVSNANAMAGLIAEADKRADTVKPSFAMMMGDNFYSRGIECQRDGHGRKLDPACTTDSSSHRFADTFENVFSQPAFDDFPFYVLLGNHGTVTYLRPLTVDHMPLTNTASAPYRTNYLP